MIKFRKNNKSNILPVNIEELKSKVIKNFISVENQYDPSKTKEIIDNYSNNNMKVLVDVKNLKKSFGDKEVLKDISFQIREGESIGILGSNGAGKTTLVEILAGLNKPSSGEIDYLFEYKKNYLEEIGIQFQDSSYPPGLSVKEIIDFVLEIYGSKIELNELNALIMIFGINEYYKKNASSLSGGQQQRLNALLAIIHKPKLLFLDEISTGLDITIRTRIKDFIKDYARENNMTLALVSHDIDEVEFLVDRILIIDKGNVIVNVSKNKILEEHKKLSDFITPYIRT